VTFREGDDPLPLLLPLIADLVCGLGYGQIIFEPFTAEVIPELERRCIASVVRCFAHVRMIGGVLERDGKSAKLVVKTSEGFISLTRFQEFQ
jgi:hypothetical protein